MKTQSHVRTNDSWVLQVHLGLGLGVMASATNQTMRIPGAAKTIEDAHRGTRRSDFIPSYWRTKIGDSVLVFAGETRLDNHLELAGRLGLPPNASDAEIICQAYVSDKSGFQKLLLGDFSFALFDEGRFLLQLVRDQLGVCPLYYQLKRHTCIASNSLDSLLDHSAPTDHVQDNVVAEWSLSGHVFNQEDTFFQSVKKCPRATVLRIDAKEARSETYWGAIDISPIRYANNGDYIEHLQELLTTAIGDRMDSSRPLAAHSSGGLDSTPIAIVAGRASRKFEQAFHTFNWCKPDKGDSPSVLEWDNARRVAQAEGFEHHEIGASADTVRKSLFTHDIARDGTTTFEYELDILQQAQHLGIRQIYSGFGGDEFLTAVFREQHYDEVRAGRFVNAYKRLDLELSPMQDMRWLRLSIAYGRLLFKSMWPKKLLLRNFYRLEGALFRAHRELLNDQFAEYAIRQRPNGTNLLTNTIRQRQSAMLTAGYHQERMECWDTLGRRSGIRYVYPFLDKRIVEFAMAIPPELFFKHGQPRHLYLRALGDTVPDFLSHNAKLAETFRVRQLIREHLKALSDPEIHEMIANANSPYVNTKALLTKCRAIRNLDANNLIACTVHVLAATTAIRTLNINKVGGQTNC